MFKKAKENKKGFTLAELLIVVAIIAVLVAISIPIFTSQLEKARESTDAANLRSAYAEVMTYALTDDATGSSNVTVNTTAGAGKYTYTASVDCQQTQTGWQDTSIDEIGGVKNTDVGFPAATTLKGWTVTYDQATGKCTFSEKSGS